MCLELFRLERVISPSSDVMFLGHVCEEGSSNLMREAETVRCRVVSIDQLIPNLCFLLTA